MNDTKIDFIDIHSSSPTNSTIFTDCCGCAVTNRKLRYDEITNIEEL